MAYPAAENDFRENGEFSYRMEAKDGSAGFDFEGTYNSIEKQKSITYALTDGRRVTVNFQSDGNTTFIGETFEAEDTYSLEMQKEGWQAILDNFKTYVEQQ